MHLDLGTGKLLLQGRLNFCPGIKLLSRLIGKNVSRQIFDIQKELLQKNTF